MRAFFEAEARRHLEALNELLSADGTDGPAGLLDHVRALRGTAHIAREDSVLRAARPLEAALKAIVRGELDWSPAVRARAADAVADVDAVIGASRDDADVAERITGAAARWHDLGIAVDAEIPTAGEAPADHRKRADFISFAAMEVAGVAEVLDGALRAFSDNPMDREALKLVLRRQRVLLGAARLDEIPAAADTLRAVEDISRIIAKMNVAIKDEWLDVFRCAKQVLDAASDALAKGDAPPHLPALSRLRTYREELLERYGAGEELSPNAPAAAGLVRTVTAEAALAPAVLPHLTQTAAGAPALSAEAEAATSPNPLDIQDLIYTGEAALRRALELRARLERAVEDDPDALALVDEVFDLIRLALK